jgi:hypothetical protein
MRPRRSGGSARRVGSPSPNRANSFAMDRLPRSYRRLRCQADAASRYEALATHYRHPSEFGCVRRCPGTRLPPRPRRRPRPHGARATKRRRMRPVPPPAVNWLDSNVNLWSPIRISTPGFSGRGTARSSLTPLSNVPLVLLSITNAWSPAESKRIFEMTARDLWVVDHQPTPVADPSALPPDEKLVENRNGPNTLIRVDDEVGQRPVQVGARPATQLRHSRLAVCHRSSFRVSRCLTSSVCGGRRDAGEYPYSILPASARRCACAKRKQRISCSRGRSDRHAWRRIA